MVYARVEADGNVKSSVDKFYSQEVLQQMKAAFNAKPGDLILILSGDDAMKTRKAAVRNCASKWDASSACATRINSHASGWSTSPCLSGATRSSASWPCTIRSLTPRTRTYPPRHRSSSRARRCLRHGNQRRRGGRRLNPYPRQPAASQDV